MTCESSMQFLQSLLDGLVLGASITVVFRGPFPHTPLSVINKLPDEVVPTRLQHMGNIIGIRHLGHTPTHLITIRIHLVFSWYAE